MSPTPLNRRRALLGALAGLSTPWLAGCMHLKLQTSGLLQGDSVPESARLPAGARLERETLQTPEGALALVWASLPGDRPLIMYCGGNTFRMDLSGGDILETLLPHADVLMWDYPGMGRSTGVIGVESLVRAGRAVRQAAQSRHAASRQPLVLYGFSMGGFVVGALGAEGAGDALVFEATARQVSEWVDTQLPWFARPFVRIDIDPTLAQLDNGRLVPARPVLVLAGGKDARAAPRLSRSLAEQLQAAGHTVTLEVFEGRDHGEVPHDPGFASRFAQWMASLPKGERLGSSALASPAAQGHHQTPLEWS